MTITSHKYRPRAAPRARASAITLVADAHEPFFGERQKRVPYDAGFQPLELVQFGNRWQNVRWGGWGSNPRPADYEKYDPMLHAP